MEPISRGLTPENQQEFEKFVAWLKANPGHAFAAALEQKLLNLALMQDRERIRGALEESGVNWLDRWRIMQGLPASQPTEQARGDGLTPMQLEELRAEEQYDRPNQDGD